MVNKVARFEKVSYERFKEDYIKHVFGGEEMEFMDDLIKDAYNKLKLPKRATKGSAGYDFFSPMYFRLEPGQTIVIPTGIRCWINERNVLMLFPRSGHGFKYRLQLDNTVGIIDNDYYYSDNEGHIMIKVTNDSKKEDNNLIVTSGVGIAQGIFLEFGLATDDEVEEERNGGFGSTDKKA